MTNSLPRAKHTSMNVYAWQLYMMIQYKHFRKTHMTCLFQSSDSSQQWLLLWWCISTKIHCIKLMHLVRFNSKVKIELPLYMSCRYTRGSDTTALPFLHLSIRRRWAGCLTHCLFYLWGKRPQCPLKSRLGGHQWQSRRLGEEKDLFLLPGFKPQIIHPTAQLTYWLC